MDTLLSLTGLRTDGRLPLELRRVRLELGTTPGTDGSSSFELGGTKVLVSVRGPRESSSTFGVTAQVVISPFAGTERRRRDRAARELAKQLERALGRCVDAKTFPKSRVDLQVRVLQADGGLPWACFTACSLALMDAGVPMKDLCVACGAAFVDRTVVIDPNAGEAAGFGGSGGELWIAMMPRDSTVLFCSFTGKVSQATFDELNACAEEGCKQLFSMIDVYVSKFYRGVGEHDVLVDEEGDAEFFD